MNDINNDRFKILTWNIRNGGSKNCNNTINAIFKHQADFIVLTEYKNKNKIQLSNAFQENGYEFVHPNEVDGVTENVTSRNLDLGDKVRFLVGAGEKGEPMYAYLMKIKEEFWLEDQAQLQERNDKTDAAIRQGKTPGVDSSGFYNAGIKY